MWFPNCNVLSMLKKGNLRAHYGISLPSNKVFMEVQFHLRFSCLSDFCVAAISRRNFCPIVVIFHSPLWGPY